MNSYVKDSFALYTFHSYEKKVYTVRVNNSSDINNKQNEQSPDLKSLKIKIKTMTYDGTGMDRYKMWQGIFFIKYMTGLKITLCQQNKTCFKSMLEAISNLL